MPPLPPVPATLKVTLQGNASTVNEYPWQNILHFSYSGTPPSSATCSTMASSIDSAWGTHMAPECPSTTVLNYVQVIDLTSPTSGGATVLPSTPGTRGDDEIPANAAVLISYPIDVRYRGGHPRSYLLAGGNADFLDAAHWSSAFTDEVESHWQAFLTECLTVGTAGCVLTSFGAVSYISKVLNPTPPYRRTTPLFYPIAVDTAVANEQMASQRRRIGRKRR